MDGSRFDEIAKALATGVSRRSVLRGLAAGATAAVMGLVRGQPRGAEAEGLPRACGATPQDLQSCIQFADDIFKICNKGCTKEPSHEKTACYGNCASIHILHLNRCQDASTPCPPGTVCSNDLCCPDGEVGCGGACVDTTTDPANCGGCGTVCDDCSTCQDGTCVSSCGPCQFCQGGLLGHFCDDVVCQDPCQACDQVSGVCEPKECPTGRQCFEGYCVCEMPCPEGQTQDPETCACECSAGTDCGDGRCIDTNTDSANCGSCGTACGEGETCSGGSCVSSGCAPISCPEGQTQNPETCQCECSGFQDGCAAHEVCQEGACVAVCDPIYKACPDAQGVPHCGCNPTGICFLTPGGDAACCLPGAHTCICESFEQGIPAACCKNTPDCG